MPKENKPLTYADAVVDLVRAAGEADLSVELGTPQGDEAQLCETVFGPACAADIGRMGYPKTFDMPWIVEYLDFYGLEELSDRQVGYRAHGITGERLPDWPDDHFVIAAWAANPITVGSDGAISYSVHGVGSWTFSRIAPDLPSFFVLLAAWIRYFIAERGGALFGEDEDIQVLDKMRADIRREVLGSIAEADKDAMLAFLLGETNRRA